MGSGNWIVDNLNSALEMWNGRLAEIWQLISTSPGLQRAAVFECHREHQRWIKKLWGMRCWCCFS